MPILFRIPRVFLLVGLVASLVGPATERAFAQQGTPDPYPLRPPNTASPRDTLQSFETSAAELVRRVKARASPAAIDDASARMLRCLDLSQLPAADRADRGAALGLLLLEILGRVELPPLEKIPGTAEVAAGGISRWTIPNTEIEIARTAKGPDAGTFQFTAETVARLPAFYERVKDLPHKPGAPVGVYRAYVYSPGPWLPLGLTTGLPAFAYTVLLGQMLWQWVATLVVLALGVAVIALAYLSGRRLDRRLGRSGHPRQAGRMIAMMVAVPLIYLISLFLDHGVNLIGSRLFFLDLALRVAEAIAAGWLLVLVVHAVGEAIIRARSRTASSLDDHLVRLVTRLVAILLLIYLAVYLAETFGVPVAPLIASLGVGGLALALAVRPTLENVIAGFILFADKPVRVGDFCMFGGTMATVEDVGLRSTRLRALDRTLITVPNSAFAQMQITNFSRRDQLQLQSTLALRYETTPDQLRYVLTRLREIFVAHPRVSAKPARARFIGFGAYSLNVEVSIYILTQSYEEFLGIAEDINLRIMEVVSEAGTGFAFPSQIAYLAKDKGVEAERSRAAEAAVEAWRAEGALQFPTLDPERVAKLDGTLDFPPKGSAHDKQAASAQAERARGAQQESKP